MADNYDVFLSHNQADEVEVEKIATRLLRETGLRPFLDRWNLVPGEPWIPALERALERSQTVAVFFGPSGIGEWHDAEKQLALDLLHRAREDGHRVIPVVLPGGSRNDVEGFLRTRTWVDLAGKDGFDRLVAGITGRAPGPPGSTRPRAGAKVFISYRTNAEPDRSFCDHVRRVLGERGHHVFVDREIVVGQRWADEIRRGVEGADYLVLLLTDESSHSEMVRGEVEMARDAASTRNGLPQILPVRLAFQGALPYPLSSYLEPLQYLYWRDEQDTEAVLEGLARAVAGEPAEPEVRHWPVARAVGSGRPTPAANVPARLPPPGGALDIDDPLYIARSTDMEALRVIRQDGGQTISIKGARQIGKSSLLMRVLGAALDQQRHAVLLDFQLFSGAADSASAFFRHFIREITEQLDLASPTDEDWDPQSTPAQSCTRLMERKVLRPLERPLTLACDEADLISGVPFRNDFFGMLRAWHNKRANPIPVQRAMWRQLDLVLVTSTEPYLFIDRHDQSPFNVGSVLSLADFDRAQVARLDALHGSPFGELEIDRLLELTGGQAYLVRKALYTVSGNGQAMPPSALFATATADTGPFGDHLRRHLLNMLENPGLVPVLNAVIAGRGTVDEGAIHRLVGAGLVRREGARVIPRCGLYRDYFRERLVGRG